MPEELNLPAQLGALQRKAWPCMFEKTANSVLCLFSAHVYSWRRTGTPDTRSTLSVTAVLKSSPQSGVYSFIVEAQITAFGMTVMLLLKRRCHRCGGTPSITTNFFRNTWMLRTTKFSWDEICCYGNRTRLKRASTNGGPTEQFSVFYCSGAECWWLAL